MPAIGRTRMRAGARIDLISGVTLNFALRNPRFLSCERAAGGPL
jgi:hypothetical protein